MAKKKRDAAYYKARLKKDHPRIYSELVAGRYPSVRAASIAAGLIRKPSGLVALKRAWNKTAPRDQLDFLKWLRSRVPRRSSTTSSTPPSIVDAHGRLTPAAISFFSDWIVRHRVTGGQILKQIGYKNYDWRLKHALKGELVLPKHMVVLLQDWVVRHGFK